MPKGISIDEKETEIERLKFKIGRLEERIDEIEKALKSTRSDHSEFGE